MNEAMIKYKTAKIFHSQLYAYGNLGLSYFRNERKLTPEIIKKFSLGYSKPYGTDYGKIGATTQELADAGLIVVKDNGYTFDRFAGRVIFPIWNEEGVVTAFGGRLVEDSLRPKYINSKETDLYKKNSTLYALNFAKDSPFDSFILCEGYMDVISLHQAGFTNAIASCGTAITDKHLDILQKYGRKVYVATDSDEAGTKAAVKTVKKLLQRNIKTARVNFNPYKDIDEAITNGADIQQILNEAEAPEHFLFRASGGDMEMLKWLLERKMSDSDI